MTQEKELLRDDQRAEEFADNGADDRTEDWTEDRSEDRTEDRAEDRTEDRAEDRTEDWTEDRAEDRTEDRSEEMAAERTAERPLSTEDIANADQRVDEAPAKHTASDPNTPHELFPEQEVQRLRVEWQEIQARFVDDPREAVQGADQLVAEVMRSLATTFTDHKHELEGQWQQGSEAETEDLRRALQRYRSFFNQLLKV